jgi:hypothetical protein
MRKFLTIATIMLLGYVSASHQSRHSYKLKHSERDSHRQNRHSHHHTKETREVKKHFKGSKKGHAGKTVPVKDEAIVEKAAEKVVEVKKERPTLKQ